MANSSKPTNQNQREDKTNQYLNEWITGFHHIPNWLHCLIIHIIMLIWIYRHRNRLRLNLAHEIFQWKFKRRRNFTYKFLKCMKSRKRFIIIFHYNVHILRILFVWFFRIRKNSSKHRIRYMRIFCEFQIYCNSYIIWLITRHSKSLSKWLILVIFVSFPFVKRVSFWTIKQSIQMIHSNEKFWQIDARSFGCIFIK